MVYKGVDYIILLAFNSTDIRDKRGCVAVRARRGDEVVLVRVYLHTAHRGGSESQEIT
jgi:hypothetical protein